jgi:alkane 1-monooxygenase
MKEKEFHASTPTETDESLDQKYIKEKTSLSPLPYYCVYIFPLISLYCTYKGGLWVWFTPFILYFIIPTLELLVGRDGYNPSKEECKVLESQIAYKLITWIWTPFQLLFILASCWMISQPDQTWNTIIGTTISAGIITGGIGITVAHELIHKNSRFEQELGKITLASVGYFHFYTEHLFGHHKRVSTPEDPATSRYGETLYAFLPRTVIGSYLSAWHLESKRMAKSNLPIYSWHNLMVQEIVYFIGTVLSLYLVFGALAPIFWVFHNVIAVFMLEVVNYIEHYGLQRKEISKGRYERVTPLHSWNADHVITNFILFKLQRHADHHTWPFRRYQTLRSWDFSPQLPTGYTGMMLLALFPPLYFAVMNPKVTKYNSLYASASEMEQIEAS